MVERPLWVAQPLVLYNAKFRVTACMPIVHKLLHLWGGSQTHRQGEVHPVFTTLPSPTPTLVHEHANLYHSLMTEDVQTTIAPTPKPTTQ